MADGLGAVIGLEEAQRGMASAEAPLALRRGPRRKPTSCAVTGNVTWLTSMRARRAGPLRALELAQAAADEHAVFVEERDDVGDGADGDEVEVVAEIDARTPLAGELEPGRGRT